MLIYLMNSNNRKTHRSAYLNAGDGKDSTPLPPLVALMSLGILCVATTYLL